MEFAKFIQSNWKPITAIVSVILTALSTLGIVTVPRAKGRQKLKLDLEIYKLMKESDEAWIHQENIKREIESISKKIYIEDDGFRHAYHTFVGIVLAGVFGWWTYEIVRNDKTESFEFSWWALLTIYWCAVGLSIMAAAIYQPLRRKLWGVHPPLGAPAPASNQQAKPASR